MEDITECKTDICTWMFAKEPNYSTNIDLLYPYSEIPYTGQYNLVKIPESLNDLIQHVDYFGEGRIDNRADIIGFPNSYNVNYQYRLVSSGLDRDKKIPNRIPLVSYNDCDTSAYIRDNSILIVTVPYARINNSCAKDIARMVNNDHGLVVAYRECFSKVEQMKPLVDELKKRGLLPSKDFILPSELAKVTFYDSHVAFVCAEKKKETELNENEIKNLTNLLYDRVWRQDWPKSLEISRKIGKNVVEVVTKLLKLEPKRVIPFAYKLWHDGAQDIVRNHFPMPYQYILDKNVVTIIDKEYDMALKMGSILNPGSENRAIFGVESKVPRFTTSMTWRFFPMCTNDDPYIAFRIRNHTDKTLLFLKMSDEKVDGDAFLAGSPMSQDELADKRYMFRLESWITDDGNVEFSLKNLHNNQRIKLEVNKTDTGDRRAWGHGKIAEMSNRLKWYIAPKSIPE